MQFWRVLHVPLPQGRLDGSQDHIESDIDEVDTGERNHQIPSDNDARIQNVIEDVQKRGFIRRIVFVDDDAAGIGGHVHTVFASPWRETKEYGGQGPVASICR
jgi:hypothetical protein